MLTVSIIILNHCQFFAHQKGKKYKQTLLPTLFELNKNKEGQKNVVIVVVVVVVIVGSSSKRSRRRRRGRWKRRR